MRVFNWIHSSTMSHPTQNRLNETRQRTKQVKFNYMANMEQSACMSMDPAECLTFVSENSTQEWSIRGVETLPIRNTISN